MIRVRVVAMSLALGVALGVVLSGQSTVFKLGTLAPDRSL